MDRTVADLNEDDVAALASAIYGEARSQGRKGKAAVAHTALTRSQIAGVPVSDVVYGSVSDKYGQYSFANPNDPNARATSRAPQRDPDEWAEAVEVARGVLSGEIENPVPGATNYIAAGVNPSWTNSATNLGKLGGHTFYSLPRGEIRGVVRQAAASPYRREALVSADQLGGTLGREPGIYEDMPDVDGNPQTISIGEFDFAGGNVERGFGRMTPETQHTASEIARTLPDGQDLTVTATHGQHGLSNLTHTPGAAFDVRTRTLNSDQVDDLIDSTLYSQPAAIGYNSGAGKFPAHMHVDTNAGYGTGLQSTSDLTGLSDYAKQELARYDADMKSGLGYAPPVPESIAPVPEARPTYQDQIARNPFDTVPQTLGAPPVEVADLSGGVSGMVDPVNPSTTSDGVPINRVKSISIKPGESLPAPAEQPPTEEPASFLSSFNPVGAAYAGVPPATAHASISLGPEPEAEPVSAIGSGTIGFTPGAKAETEIGLSAPDVEVDDLPALPDLPAREVKTLPEVYTPREEIETEPAVAAPQREKASSPVASASEVWSGQAAEGVASDGSKLSRNPDGSISRFSEMSGKTEKVSDSVPDWSGPSIGDTTQKTGGFWSEKAAGTLPGGGQSYKGGEQIRQGPSLMDKVNDAINSLKDSIQGTLGQSTGKSGGRDSLSSYGQHAYDSSQQVRDAVDSGSVGLW